MYWNSLEWNRQSLFRSIMLSIVFFGTLWLGNNALISGGGVARLMSTASASVEIIVSSRELVVAARLTPFCHRSSLGLSGRSITSF